MKTPILIAVLVLVPIAASCGEKTAFVETQRDIEQSWSDDFQKSEAQMKTLIDRLVQKAKGKPEAIKKLQSAQAAWERYRDAQVEALWPDPAITNYGSAHAMCVGTIKAQLTEARIKELEAMLTPQEGDVCASWPE